MLAKNETRHILTERNRFLDSVVVVVVVVIVVFVVAVVVIVVGVILVVVIVIIFRILPIYILIDITNKK